MDRQWTWKEARALTRRLQLARFKERGVVEDISYQHPRGLDRKLIRTLATSDWVRLHHNVLLVGPTGIGKSWLACALAHKACRDGFFALHKRMAELFRDLIVDRPRAYFAAVFRTVLVFLGVPPHHSENTLFVSNVLSLSVPGSKCVCPEEDQGAFANTFARTGQRTPIHYLLKIVTPAYVPLVMIGSGFTLFAFAVGARRGDPALLALTAVPVAFAAAHAMLLLGTDRFAMPVFPLALVNLVVFLPAFVQSIRSSRARRSVIPISGRAEERASSRCGPHSGLVPPTA